MELPSIVLAAGRETPGTISAQERELLIDMLEGSRDLFVASVSAASQLAWQGSASQGSDGQGLDRPGPDGQRRPGRDAWSVAECAEHVALSEPVLRDLARDLVLSSPSRPAHAASVQGKDGAIVRAMRDRSRRAKTLPILEPTGRWPTRAELVTEFLEQRAATLAYVRGTRDPLHYHFAPLEPFGDLDGYQWLLLLASHTERHAAQMRGVPVASR
jgi:hypothetical protein